MTDPLYLDLCYMKVELAREVNPALVEVISYRTLR